MKFTRRVQQLFGRSEGESSEEFMRRIEGSPYGSKVGQFIRPVVPPIVDLYDRIALLERRIQILEGQNAPEEKGA